MKKYLSCFLVFLMTLSLSLTQVSASDYSDKLTNAYNKAVSYYQSKRQTGFESYDDILASESVGVEADEALNAQDLLTEELPYLHLEDRNKTNIGTLGKMIVLTCLMGKDPQNIDGQNLVEALESRVQEDGSIVNSTGANNDIWALYGLYVINSDKQQLVGNYLAQEALDSGAYWFSSSWKSADVDTTGWAIEVLSLVNKTAYQSSIAHAIAYIKSVTKNENNQTVFTIYGGNANTQGCVLEGLVVADREGLFNDCYNAPNAANPYDYLLTWQLDDGSFKAMNYDANYQPIGVGYNNMATRDGILALGTYKNGSVFDKAKRDYDKTLHPIKNYQLTNGNKATITKGQSYTLSTDISQANIQSISVDGKQLDRSYYTVNKTITLSANYLNTLALGQHTIVISALDGKASGTFTLIASQEEVKKPVQEVKQPIKKATSTTPVKQEKKVAKRHKAVDTSDSTDIKLYVLLVILTGLGIVLLRRYRHV